MPIYSIRAALINYISRNCENSNYDHPVPMRQIAACNLRIVSNLAHWLRNGNEPIAFFINGRFNRMLTSQARPRHTGASQTRMRPWRGDRGRRMQSLHRARDRLVGERTALINQLRGLLFERGIVVPKGRRKLEVYLDELMGADPASLGTRIRMLIDDMRMEWRELDRRISALDHEFGEHARSDETACLLSTIPGIGILNATALAAAIGNAQTFKRGRDLAAWLGLVPKQMTTGGKPKLLGITKRGNVYLRKMIIHGARAAFPSISASETPVGAWLRSLRTRVHMNTAVVALANKLARIVWAVLRTGQPFKTRALVIAA
jgi:transposase